jgi:hypothetical protein
MGCLRFLVSVILATPTPMKRIGISVGLALTVQVGPETQSELALLRIQLDDLESEFVTDGDDVFRLRHPFMTQLGDVQKPLNPILQLDESTEVREANHFSPYVHANTVFVRDSRLPGIWLALLEAERDSAVGFVHVQDNSLDFVTPLQDL